jgi:hypothetical protein
MYRLMADEARRDIAILIMIPVTRPAPQHGSTSVHPGPLGVFGKQF